MIIGMTVPPILFCMLLLIAALFLAVGRWLGEQNKHIARFTLIAAFVLIALAAVPRFHPTLLHTTLPLSVSIYLEGTLATFPLMLMAGALWGYRPARNLRRTGPLLIVLAVVYFLFSGIWMVLPDIRFVEREHITAQGVTLQRRSDTCAPSACATALRRMGITTTEAEMSHAVLAKPGRGSTLARAAYGLRQHLAPHGINVSLMDLDADEVVRIARPAQPVLVVIRSNIAADHMVVVLGRLGNGVVIANPSPGEHGGVEPMPFKLNYGFEMFKPADFARLCRRGAIVFERAEHTEQRR